MPLFYFNIFNDELTHDDEGAELLDLSAARGHAVAAARSFAAASVAEGHLCLDDRIEIEDSDRKIVATVTFGDAVEMRERQALAG